MNKTVKLQKRAIHTINKSGFNSHTNPLFKRSGILKLKDSYEYQTNLIMLDFINNRPPLSFNSTFQFHHQILNIHTTRQINLLHITRCEWTFLANSNYIYFHSDRGQFHFVNSTQFHLVNSNTTSIPPLFA